MKRVFFWVAFLGLLVSFGNEGWVKWFRLRQLEKLMEEKNHLLSQNNTLLRKEIELLHQPATLERTIREELGYVKQDEILYDDSRTLTKLDTKKDVY